MIEKTVIRDEVSNRRALETDVGLENNKITFILKNKLYHHAIIFLKFYFIQKIIKTNQFTFMVRQFLLVLEALEALRALLKLLHFGVLFLNIL